MFTHFSQWLNELHAVPLARAGSCPRTPQVRGWVAVLNLQLFLGRAQICDIWLLQCGFSGGTEVDQKKFIPRSRAVWSAQDGLGPLLSWAWNCLQSGITMYNVLDFLTPYDLFASMKRMNLLLWASCSPAASFLTVSQWDALEQAGTCGLAQSPLADRQAWTALFWVYCWCFVTLQMVGGARVGSFWLANDKFTLVRL